MRFKISYPVLQFIRLKSRDSAHAIHKTNKNLQKLVLPLQNPALQALPSSQLLRNVGIIAHVDAGKTTTTERILFYSGMTDKIGSVDAGTTVTDYLVQEKEKGITIVSAAVSLLWKSHTLTLLDTPGHIDFTYEVERSLHAVDSAVAVLDGSAGVESQTETVWEQADRYKLPRLIFVNKMDKPAAELEKNLTSIKKSLKMQPLLLQIPVGQGKEFTGVVDLLNMNILTWTKDPTSQSFDTQPITRDHSDIYAEARKRRNDLIDLLAEHNDTLMDVVLSASSYDEISSDLLSGSVRQACLLGQGVPVLLGSSLKNCGVQPLLDAMVQYLPPPRAFDGLLRTEDMFGLVFKTVHDTERGLVTFIRLYNGGIKPSNIYNASRSHSEKIGKLFMIEANQLIEVKSAAPGSIVAVTGLSQTVSGDVITKNSNTAQTLNRTTDIALPQLTVPDPVFMCSVEPESSSQQKPLDDALHAMSMDDPSLRVKYNEETMQCVLYGMGELHLDIIKDRLKTEHRVDAYFGPMTIAYRETISSPTEITEHELHTEIDEQLHHIRVILQLVPADETNRKAVFVQNDGQSWNNIRWQERKAINMGIGNAFNSGPLSGCQVVKVEAHLLNFQVLSRRTNPSMMTAAVYETVHKALSNTDMTLLEPIMKVQIKTANDYTSLVLKDLTRRRAEITEVNRIDEHSMIICTAPVAALLGYSSQLRRDTSGQSRLTMELSGYRAAHDSQVGNMFL